MEEVRNLYMWGTQGDTMEHPFVETIQSFLDRKQGVFTPLTELGIDDYLTSYKAKVSSRLEWFRGTPTEWEAYKIAYPIVNKADKGQQVENAIELNDAVKYYIKKLITDNDFTIKSDLYEIALDNTNVTKQNKYQTDMKTRRAYIRMLDNVEEFERSIAIATNSDPSHPVNWIHENDFVNILSHMAIDDKPRYAEVAKLLNVEATYEPEAVKNEYIKLQQIINSHIHQTIVHQIDGNTLAGELANAGGRP